jgi:hypothetical protein
MLDIRHFTDIVVRPTLRFLAAKRGNGYGQPPYSEKAVDLLVGTALMESGLRFLDQGSVNPVGPARGLFQIEPATRRDIDANYLAYRPALREAVEQLLAPVGTRDEQLATNLCYAAAMARIVYLRAPEALPEYRNVGLYALYWKRHYNTLQGKGDAARFEALYRQHVQPVLDFGSTMNAPRGTS